MAAKSQTKASTKGKKASKSTGRKSSASKTGISTRTAGKSLVIVESPAKARTVGQMLGSKYVVAASQGHVRDLPKSKIGVDVDNEFQPSYVIMRDKRAILNDLIKAGDQASTIYLATDPDREGEAISWHLQAAAQWDQRADPPKRVIFHEITKQAVEEAFKHPREIDMELVNAQQARRILDRLVGYQISPLLWRRVQRGTSAGRVQSVSLRMVVDREREIQSFVPVESWTLEAQLHKDPGKAANADTFTAVLHSTKGQRGRLVISKEEEARSYQAELKDAGYIVADVKKREVRQRPTAPFTTSTMQQEAGRKLSRRFTAQHTMAVAQQLYEGLPLGDGKSEGLITYMRTDSVQVTPAAVSEARSYIVETYGKEYVPEKPRLFKTKAKAAQEAHEAIRPTSIRRTPDSLRPYLSREQLGLYRLVWSRMLASQMSDARSQATTVDIEAACRGSSKVYIFRATGSVLIFPGFRALYMESRDDGEEEGGRQALPEIAAKDNLACTKLDALQHFTQPPPRYTEATLIKAMEEKGIGRPSTYAPTVGTLLGRHYVDKEQNRLVPTTLGTTITDLMVQFFSDVMDLDFTAKMEEGLDEVSRGEREWVPMLQEFYGPFQQALEIAEESMPRTKVEEETDEVCEKCGRPMVIKTGRFGRFLACTGTRDECGATKNIVKRTGASCPKPDCDGELIERRARKTGRTFFGCSKWPDCDFLTNGRPVPTPCPECNGLMVQQGRSNAACTNCAWKQPLEEQSEDQSEELVPVGD